MPNLGVIIQARTGSTRLPGKVLMEAAGESIIQRIYRICSGVYQTVVAIPFGDEALAKHLAAHNIPFFTGHATDVLDRYVHCAREHRFDNVIRVTGDCPLLSTETLFWIGEQGLKGSYDFYTNAGPGRTSIDGEDCEFISIRLLEFLAKNIDDKLQREHVTAAIYETGECNSPFSFYAIEYWRDTGKDLSDIKTSIDTQDDFDTFKNEVEL